MPSTCSSCRKDRELKGQAPRQLVELPQAVTDDKKLFKKLSAPTFVCEHCDGESLIASALVTDQKRQTK